MPDYRLEIGAPTEPLWRARIHAGLIAFNQSRSAAFATVTPTDSGARPLDVLAFDTAGELVGGLLGHTRWDWLEIDELWVGEEHRGLGLGRRVLVRAEEAACGRGCRHAVLRAYSFQARGFYEHAGYRIVGELTDWPPGHTSFWLSKDW